MERQPCPQCKKMWNLMLDCTFCKGSGWIPGIQERPCVTAAVRTDNQTAAPLTGNDDDDGKDCGRCL